MILDRTALFTGVRHTLFHDHLIQPQVDGINILCDTFIEYKFSNLDWLAYVLGTVYEETAYTMTPIDEYGHGKGHPYGKKGKYKQAAYGRGFVQLTWDYNYEKADKTLGLNGALLKNFELAKQLDIAAKIAIRGMTEGWFTGYSLKQFFNDHITDYVHARKIINGLDQANAIAVYSKTFRKALVVH